MKSLSLLLLGVLWVVVAQAQVKVVPKDLDQAEAKTHQPALVLLNEIYKNRNKLSAEGEKPSGRAIAFSRSILQDGEDKAIEWLKEKGYITTSIQQDRFNEKLYPLVHLNPDIEWEAVSGSSTPVEYTLSTALAKSGYHKRKAWTMQATAFGVFCFGGSLAYLFASSDSRGMAIATGLITGWTVSGLQIAFLSHKIREGRALEAIPGGARFRF